MSILKRLAGAAVLTAALGAAVPVDLVPVVAAPSDLQSVLAFDLSLSPADRPPDVGRVGLTLPLLN